MNKNFEPNSNCLTFQFENDAAARNFKIWLAEGGEQAYWDWVEDYETKEDGPVTGIIFDYWKENIIQVTCGRLNGEE